VLAGLSSGWIGRIRRQGVALTVAVVGWGACVAISGLAHQLWLAVVLLAFAGAADLVSAVYRQTILQTYAPDEMRGRCRACSPPSWRAVRGWATCGPAPRRRPRPPPSPGSAAALACIVVVIIAAVAVRPFWKYEPR